MDIKVYNESDNHCLWSHGVSSAHVFIVQMALISALPILILSVCNILITVNLFRRDKMLAYTGSDSHGPTQNALLASMTTRTVAISFVQCITAIPMLTLDTYTLFVPLNNTISFAYSVCNTVMYLNHGINFVFYCLFGRSFRRDCVDLFTRRSAITGN